VLTGSERCLPALSGNLQKVLAGHQDAKQAFGMCLEHCDDVSKRKDKKEQNCRTEYLDRRRTNDNGIAKNNLGSARVELMGVKRRRK
jgi:hypothetical protein